MNDEETPDEQSPCEKPNILTHNGVFTVKNPLTGEHRTYKIRTQKPDANFAPGKRVVSMLTGSDNTHDYTGFGFVLDTGIQVWKKQAHMAAHAKMLENLAEHARTGKVEVFAATRCRVCNRTLTTPESVASGIGPICEEALCSRS